jgi:acetyl-CoA acetyltransferase family protein
MMQEAVIVDACRTAVGRAGDRGVFRAIAGRDMMVPVMQAIVKRTGIDPGIIDDVIMGGGGFNDPARLILLLAGYPESVSGGNTTRFCPSSQYAFSIAAHYVQTGDADVMLACGMETMDRTGPVPASAIGKRGIAAQARMEGPKDETPYPPDWKFADVLPTQPAKYPAWIHDMGATAEELSRRFHITRADSDEYSVHSHEKAIAAQDAGIFKREIVPVTINYKDGTKEVVDTDQCPRRGTTLEKVASVPPAYQANGWVTAANSCPRSDAATAVLVMSKKKAKELGLKPLCTVRSTAVVGCDPTVMGVGPYPATEKLLKRTGMKINDFDLIEINEAFACQVLYCGRELKFTKKNWDGLNVNGGAIALGHPISATGCRLIGTLAHELKHREARWGLSTLCGATGVTMATALEREKYDW